MQTDAEKYSKKFCKSFKIKNLREYHDLYVQSDTLMYLTIFQRCLVKYINYNCVQKILEKLYKL